MTYIFYKIVKINNKNKRVYKKKNYRKLYCKYNGKMIQVKKYEELCKKTKPVKKKRGGGNSRISPRTRASPRASQEQVQEQVMSTTGGACVPPVHELMC